MRLNESCGATPEGCHPCQLTALPSGHIWAPLIKSNEVVVSQVLKLRGVAEAASCKFRQTACLHEIALLCRPVLLLQPGYM
jgi:hypothetical protein